MVEDMIEPTLPDIDDSAKHLLVQTIVEELSQTIDYTNLWANH